MSRPFIIECNSSEEANKVDMELYRFEKHSDSRDVYIFVRRATKKNE